VNEPSTPVRQEGEPQSQAAIAAESPWARIKEHKVLQWCVAYLGASLALAHGQDLLSHTFHWPELIGRILIGTLIVGLPVVIALAWYHGHKGVTHVSAGEMTVVSVMLVIGAGLLIALVRVPEEQVHESAAAPTAARDSTVSPAPAAAAVVASETTTSATARKPRIAILPFENLSPDPANAFFADGLHEEILATLAQRAPGLEVISRTTMMMYRAKPMAIAEMARELGATHVIEGSVRRAGKRVRLTLQLIAASTDDHIWAQDYDRTLTDALTLESEVANQVAAQLAVEFKNRSAGIDSRTYNPDGYDLYIKALGMRNAMVAVGSGDVQPIMNAFTRAIDVDPTLGPAYAERLFGYLRQISSDGGEAARHAREDLETAERVAPSDPKVLAARAWYYEYAEHDWEGALRAFSAAEAAGLTDPDELLDKSVALSALGRNEESVRFVQGLLTLDPRNRLVIGWLTLLQARNRQPIDALRTVERGIRYLPDASELKKMRAELIFDFSGDPGALNSLAPGDDSLSMQFYRLRFSHQYAQLNRLLAATPASTRVFPDGLQFGPFIAPIERLRGWTSLLMGEPFNARRSGRALLEVVARQPETKWNRIDLRTLAAEGHALTGERAQAVEAAQQALDSVRDTGDRGSIFGAPDEVRLRLAAVLAWSGARDQAVDLLEETAKTIPGPGPLRIARDPLYTLPLATDSRFRQLVSDLESQARATRLE
jgi:TolB-like protein